MYAYMIYIYYISVFIYYITVYINYNLRTHVMV